MNPNFLNAALVICVFSGAAQASTLRVTCDDGAAGAEVSVNGKFKGECPVDIQVAEGKVVLKATKLIDGKKEIFEQKLRIGDGVVKRVEISFGGAPAGTEAGALQVDMGAVARQRYEAEMAEYNNNIQSCLPKHAIELRRLKQAVSDAVEQGYEKCKQWNIDRGMTGDWSVRCGPSSWDGSKVDSRWTDKSVVSEWRRFNSDPMSWCMQQFTKPKAP